MWGDVRGFAGNPGANAANSHLEDWTKRLIDGIWLVGMKLNSCYWILIIYKASTSLAGSLSDAEKMELNGGIFPVTDWASELGFGLNCRTHHSSTLDLLIFTPPTDEEVFFLLNK